MPFADIAEIDAMNKSFIFFLLLPLTSVSAVSAQPSKGCWEVFASRGRYSVSDIFYYNRDMRNPSVRYEPVYAGGFKYYFKDRLAAGVTIAQHSFAVNYLDNYNYNYRTHYYDAFSICPEMKMIYINSRYLQLYGTLALGVIIMNDHSTVKDQAGVQVRKDDGYQVWPSFYGSPLGIKVGNKLSAFAEVGIGFRGLYNMGVTYTWGKNMNKGS